jgi:Caspase domain/Domain of unknown function (DUF4384)
MIAPRLKHLLALGTAGWIALAPPCVLAQSPDETTTLRETELRADKVPSSMELARIPSGAAVKLLSTEGGWSMVETSAGQSGKRLRGWVRASTLVFRAVASTVSGMASGRQTSGNQALTLGVRSLPARANRHALIIGISRYADPATPPLPGARLDKESATQMAQAMQVPQGNITYLQDEQATGENIRQAIRDLTARVEDGDRVFIHYSGHGTRYNDPASGGCVEALLAHDEGKNGTITNREMAGLLSSITRKTDKLFVMYDACHSGGLVQSASIVRTRGLGNANDEGLLRPKFSNISEECGRPVNVKTRNLLVEATSQGALPQDIIHLSASRDNEVSFDDELKGGLATQFMRDCMLRDAKDLDNSGAISIAEMKQCAQEKIDRRMANDPNFKAHNLLLSGNDAFVPAWFSQPAAPINTGSADVVAAAPATVSPSVPAPVQSVGTSSTAPSAPATAAAVVADQKTLTGEQALQQVFAQRDAKRQVTLKTGKENLRIGQDYLDFSVKSEKAGYVYVALAGSDNKSLYLLFPNGLDQNNRIEAGQTVSLPRPNWRVKAGGPAGSNHLLVMVTDGPRDISALGPANAGPFVASLNDAEGRARLGSLLTSSRLVTSQACTSASARKNNPLCSDAYGAAMLAVEELP